MFVFAEARFKELPALAPLSWRIAAVRFAAVCRDGGAGAGGRRVAILYVVIVRCKLTRSCVRYVYRCFACGCLTVVVVMNTLL